MRKHLSDIALARNETDSFNLTEDTMYLPGAVHVFSTASKFANLQQLWSYTSSFPTWLERVRRNAYRDLEAEITNAGFVLPDLPPAVESQSRHVYLLTAVFYSKPEQEHRIVSSVERAQEIVDSYDSSKGILWMLSKVEIDNCESATYDNILTKNNPITQLK